MSKPITLHARGPSPNPLKVAIVLEELQVPYVIQMTMDPKAESYVALNPNGRLPAIEDPNTGFTLFESGAIIEYLVDKYDKDGKLHYTSEPEKYLTKCFLHFQMSGQGPYFGQLYWFKFAHPEKSIASAIDRYANESKRVVGVIDAHLKKKGTKYLVGDKLTYADLAFVPWFNTMSNVTQPDFDYKTEYPTFAAWFESLLSRDSFKAVMAKPEFQRR